MGGEGEGGRLRRRRERGPRGALKEGSGRGKSVSLSHLICSPYAVSSSSIPLLLTTVELTLCTFFWCYLVGGNTHTQPVSSVLFFFLFGQPGG